MLVTHQYPHPEVALGKFTIAAQNQQTFFEFGV